ncbi:MAG TPA: MFS transporter, partial [Terriglobales bacterium]|nr:MFS transporter [Terriglobales bacterium]
PIVGRLYNHVSPRLMIALGVICVALGSIDMGHFTLQTSDVGIIRVLLLQGLGFSLLFVPLTTVALSHIHRTQLTDAGGLNSLVRQLGGSVGLAIYGQLLEQYTTRARDAMLPYVDPHRLEVRMRIEQMVRGMVGRGMDMSTARASAFKALNGMVAGQSAMIAFEKIFMITGFAMLVLIPLTIFMRQKPHHEQEARDRAPAPID